METVRWRGIVKRAVTCGLIVAVKVLVSCLALRLIFGLVGSISWTFMLLLAGAGFVAGFLVYFSWTCLRPVQRSY